MPAYLWAHYAGPHMRMRCWSPNRLHYSGPHYPPAYAGPRCALCVRRCAGPSRVVCLVVGHTCVIRMLVPSCVMLAVRLDPTSAGVRKRDAGLTCVWSPACHMTHLLYATVCAIASRAVTTCRPPRCAARCPCRARSAGWVRGGGRCSSSTRALRNKSGAQRPWSSVEVASVEVAMVWR